MRSRRELKTATGDRLCEHGVGPLGARDNDGLIHNLKHRQIIRRVTKPKHIHIRLL